ncbi:Maintenance of telomere capping protein 1 [Yarrowia sp. C11]|nr:Maintenance of telomere capping protein 1 [Yarrowia sp. C11]
MTDKKQTTDDVLSMLDSLESEAKSDKTSKPKSDKKDTAASSSSDKKSAVKDDDDILGFLDSLAKNPKATPATKAGIEKVKSEVQSGNMSIEDAVKSVKEEPKEAEDDSEVDHAASAAPVDAGAAIGAALSWWNRNKEGIWDTASAAVKQAEAKVKELQELTNQEVEAAERGESKPAITVAGLTEMLKKQSLFSTVLDTIAPPISRHEQLKIHVFHDLVGYPAIDTIVYNVFSKVMQQVEGGGELKLVVQKGKERHRRGSDASVTRDLNIFAGTAQQAEKLAMATLEEYTKKDAKPEPSPEDDPEVSIPEEEPTIRVSSIFVSIQPFVDENKFQFAVRVADPDHDFGTTINSQSFPSQWAQWLDEKENPHADKGVDTRDWVVDWIEEGLGLTIGVGAQEYVMSRMGIKLEDEKK